MTIAEQIYREAQVLPDELAREVLDFIGYIETKYHLKSAKDRDLLAAQRPAMARIWDNRTDDEAWNDL
jgi:hypothetical protein